jgi:hypothetical protein
MTKSDKIIVFKSDKRNACRVANRGQLLLQRVTSVNSASRRKYDDGDAYIGSERSIPSRVSTRTIRRS